MEALFKKLLENIKLTENQEEDARKKYNGVCEVLHNYYYPQIKYNGATKLLIGSYGKSTNIRPPRDVDVLFKMPEDEFKRFDNLSGNKQSQLLQEIRLVLKDTYTTTEEIKAFGKVIVIEFADGTHNVELLPAWELSNGKFTIPNTENNGSWELSDPVTEINYISSSNKKTGKTLDIIRICKKWAGYCDVPIKSFEIELLVVQYLEMFYSATLKQSFSLLIAGFLKRLTESANTGLITPTGEAISLGDEWKSKAETASKRASKALEYESTEEMDLASEEWEKIFGDDFPKFEKQISSPVSSLLSKISALQSRYPSKKEEFLDKSYNIPFRIDSAYSIEIDAWVIQNGFRPNWLTLLLKNSFWFDKDKKLKFVITKNNVPEPYDVMWKVRNFGEDANTAGDLRGEISRDNGFEDKKENTRYQGEHYVECYIIKNNICVALNKLLVPIGFN